MPLRALFDSTPETIQDLVLAAELRYWDGLELMVQRRLDAGVYLMGYTAEMLLKTACFFVDGARPGEAAQPRLAPTRRLGRAIFPAVPDESFHSLSFWAAALERKTVLGGTSARGSASRGASRDRRPALRYLEHRHAVQAGARNARRLPRPLRGRVVDPREPLPALELKPMPVRRGLPRTTPAQAPDLEERLAKELASPSAEGQPLVFEEPEPAPITRIFVVWNDWARLGQQDRSEIILRAFERVHGADATLKVSVAMGLTDVEAERMGIPAH